MKLGVKIVLLSICIDVFGQLNNVCKNIIDYGRKDTSKNCWYNPDVDLTLPEIVKRHGFPIETHTALSIDGYILTLYRIPHNNSNVRNMNNLRQPVYLQHGLTGSSKNWIILGHRSLAFQLSNRGYDVWMSNFRGITPSDTHITMSTNDFSYWNFSFHDIGLHDISAITNYILTTNKSKKKIIYIGHSMGTTVSLVYAVTKSGEAARNLAGVILLAPVAFMTAVRSEFTAVAIFAKEIEIFVKNMKIRGFFIPPNTIENTVKDICNRPPISAVCKYLIYPRWGLNRKQFLPEDIPLFLSYVRTPASSKTLLHYLQQLRDAGRFQYYDYGPHINLKIYGSTNPIPYNVSRIRIPVHLFYGKADTVATEKDATLLFNSLSTKRSLTKIPVDDDNGVAFSHWDFIFAKDVETYLYPKMFEKMDSLTVV